MTIAPVVPEVGEWIAAMLNGGTPDQNWLALEKHFKQRFGNKRTKVPGQKDQSEYSKANADDVAVKFLMELNTGKHVGSKTGELLDQLIQGAVEEQGDSSFDAAAIRRSFQGEIGQLQAKLAEATVPSASGDVPRLRTDLRQARAWRFRLETLLRGVHAELESYLGVKQRAPTEVELGRLVDRLAEEL